MDPPIDLDTVLESALKGDIGAQIRTLESLRLGRLQHPDLALKCGVEVLSSFRGRRQLGNDLWAVYEQVLLAALHLDDHDWYQHCLKILQAQFPKSIRVRRLAATIQEKKGEMQAAEQGYADILTDKPSDCATHKRLIAMLKAQKKIGEAVEECNAYLDTFQTDYDVWHELAELYLIESNYTKASFCYVELVLNNPQNLYVVLTYAELQYTLGEIDVARKYFCLAAHIDDTNLRAMWGVIVCLVAMGKQREEKLDQLLGIAKKKIRNLYAPLPPVTQQAALTYLDSL